MRHILLLLIIIMTTPACHRAHREPEPRRGARRRVARHRAEHVPEVVVAALACRDTSSSRDRDHSARAPAYVSGPNADGPQIRRGGESAARHTAGVAAARAEPPPGPKRERVARARHDGRQSAQPRHRRRPAKGRLEERGGLAEPLRRQHERRPLEKAAAMAAH